jgi:hypothetical protein
MIFKVHALHKEELKNHQENHENYKTLQEEQMRYESMIINDNAAGIIMRLVVFKLALGYKLRTKHFKFIGCSYSIIIF